MCSSLCNEAAFNVTLEPASFSKGNPGCPCHPSVGILQHVISKDVFRPSFLCSQPCYCSSPVPESNKPVYLTFLLLSAQFIWHVVLIYRDSFCLLVQLYQDESVPLAAKWAQPGLHVLSMPHVLHCRLFTEVIYYAYCKRAGKAALRCIPLGTQPACHRIH